MRYLALIIIQFHFTSLFSEVQMHRIYQDIYSSKNIIKSTVVSCTKDSLVFSVDSLILGIYDKKQYTLAKREIRFLLYGCVDAPNLTIGDERILFFDNYLSDTIDKYKLLLDLKIENNMALLPNTVLVGLDYEYKIIEKNNDLFFDRKISLSQLYEAIRVMKICFNLENQFQNKNVKCDNTKLDFIAKTNLIIRALQLSYLDYNQRIKKKF